MGTTPRIPRFHQGQQVSETDLTFTLPSKDGAFPKEAWFSVDRVSGDRDSPWIEKGHCMDLENGVVGFGFQISPDQEIGLYVLTVSWTLGRGMGCSSMEFVIGRHIEEYECNEGGVHLTTSPYPNPEFKVV